jgi:uncharacterized protein (DUF1697 family)
MLQQKYLTLLRGINVGGNNRIIMAELKGCFESMGFSNVLTFIQSGNVIFTSDKVNKILLTKRIEEVLSDRFTYNSRIVLITQSELRDVVEEAPKGFGSDADVFRYDVLFLMESLSSADLILRIKLREGIDSASAGKNVLYFSRLISKAGQSYLSKVMALPEYKHLTIRNWNTTTKLLELMDH